MSRVPKCVGPYSNRATEMSWMLSGLEDSTREHERKLEGPKIGPDVTESRTRHLKLSELHEQGHMTIGRRLCCKEFLGFNTMPCCHMPVLVHS